jgi:hypothetical protein
VSSGGSSRGESQSFRARYARGLRTSARNNGPAYGYSVTVTATLAILAAVEGAPRVLEVFTFAGGAIAAFTLVEAAASRGFRRRLEEEPSVVEALGSAFAFLSVGGGLAAAFITALLFGRGAAWPLGAFLSTLIYLVFVGFELALAEKMRRDSGEDKAS